MEKIILATQELSSGLFLLTNLTSDILSDIEIKNGNLTISPEQRTNVLEKFSQTTPELNGAKAQIDLSLLELNSISVAKLNPLLGNYVSELRNKLTALRNFLDKSVSLSYSLPTLLGLNSEKTYLFLLQNNNELRPTGGFIGTLGILKIKNGYITFFQTNNVYDYDRFAHNRLKIMPPAPISKYLNVDGWYLRDSNWSPDFVEAAHQIEWFYHQEVALSSGTLKNYNIDGVIAITPKIISEFLSTVGAVEIDSFVFNKDNFVDRLQYLVEVGYQEQNVEYWQRKNIIGNLGQKLIARTENLNLQGWLKILQSTLDNLNAKHIQLYIKNDIVQNIINKENWSGTINSVPGDFLMVIDANLAALKSNQCVIRSIDYTLQPNMRAHVEITYKNNCTFTWKSTRYRTYTRVYVPLGSEIIESSGAMEIDRSKQAGQVDVSEDRDKTVFGAFVSIEPGAIGKLSFTYQLPAKILNNLNAQGEYQLYIQKQAGTLKDNLQLDLNFPYEIKLTYPSEDRHLWGDKQYKFSTDLEIDRQIRIGF